MRLHFPFDDWSNAQIEIDIWLVIIGAVEIVVSEYVRDGIVELIRWIGC